MSTSTADEVETPIDRFVAGRSTSTAVDRFAARGHGGPGTDDAAFYESTLPLDLPGTGEQYAFRVDLDRCSGCKSCVAACHSLNGLDEGESWRSVGQLVTVGSPSPGADSRSTGPQHVPTGCHHCVEPACLAGCPTDAYEKDSVTGIVVHLDDQCFGCGYCTLTCPYEVPRLNRRLGVVRKCDLCAGRLAVGESPACVQACPTNAISVDVVAVAALRDEVVAEGARLLPGAPDSALTIPSTRYVGAAVHAATSVAADDHALALSHGHGPLSIMLLATQCGIGAAIAGVLAGGGAPDGPVLAQAIGFVLVALGTVAAFAHLGRPLVAWRAVLGVRHSWFSREVLAFPVHLAASGVVLASHRFEWSASVIAPAAATAMASGVFAVWCSVAIYVATGRRWWRTARVGAKFGGCVAVSGATAHVLTAGEHAEAAGWVALLALVAWHVGDASLLARTPSDPDLSRTGRLLAGPARSWTIRRFALVGAALLALAASVASTHAAADPRAWVVVAAGAALGAAAIERHQFFVACAPPRMPGGFRS